MSKCFDVRSQIFFPFPTTRHDGLTWLCSPRLDSDFYLKECNTEWNQHTKVTPIYLSLIIEELKLGNGVTFPRYIFNKNHYRLAMHASPRRSTPTTSFVIVINIKYVFCCLC